MEQSKNLKIKDWAPEDRPREKLLAKGIKSLSDTELLAILIRTGQQNESAVEIARKILLLVNNNLSELGKLSVKDLEKVKGIGEAKAITLIAALELGRRRKLSEIQQKQKISGSRDAFEYVQSFVEDLSYEEFWVLYLNRSHRIIDQVKISQGGVSGTVIDVRIILKHAIEKLASSIIISHNHPSGNLEPSHADIQITKKIKQAADFHDIQVLDHIIIGDQQYYSFADERIL
jgi:DNA repair protein RadC